MSIEAQCWKIIIGGDKKITMIIVGKEEAKPLASYIEEDYKVAAKNLKTLKFIMSGLNATTKRKVLSSKSAMEK